MRVTLAFAALLAIGTVGTAAIADPNPGTTPPSAPAGRNTDTTRHKTVIHPPGAVDPGMPVLNPHVPTRSRVLHPNTGPNQSGPLVVPK